MKSVIQRVIKSKIKIEGEDYSSIDNGMLILVGFIQMMFFITLIKWL